MRKKKTPLIVGNWKMNPTTIGKARRLLTDIRGGLGRVKGKVNTAIAVPYPYISELANLSPSERLVLGAQDAFYEANGAHTGEVSAGMLKSVGAKFIIVGHSERRARGEDDKEVYRDLQAVLQSKLMAIVCVGEKKRDKEGDYFGVVETQLRAALRTVDEKDMKRVVIAYEPVWAIGSNKPTTPADAEEMRLFITKTLTSRYNRSVAEKTCVLYGGSVKKHNAESLLKETNLNGFLVGGASLKASEFLTIVNIAYASVR